MSTYPGMGDCPWPSIRKIVQLNGNYNMQPLRRITFMKRGADMIELPEAHVLAEQINQSLVGRTIHNAAANAHPHAFAWYTGDPAAYGAMLSGKKISSAYNVASCVNILCDDMLLEISTPIKCHEAGEKLPKSHQLLLEFGDGSHISCTVQMWGSIFCTPYAGRPKQTQEPSPLTDDFNETYFDNLINSVKPSMSTKAFLATEQRIPGLGNGVLQDVLFNAGLHPKRKLETMGDDDRQRLFSSLKSTLKEMTDHGGRDTEKDLFGRNGGYVTILSKNTLPYPCGVCGSGLVRQAFLGGNIYFCPTCQPL